MTEQETQQLREGIAEYARNPNPAPAQPKPLAPGAGPAEREAHNAAMADYEITQIMRRPASEATKEDQDKLRAAILKCLKDGV